MAEFPRGTVIVCPECYRPIYALERGIGPHDRAGRAASAFRPITQRDITEVCRVRPDVPVGWQVEVQKWRGTEQAKRVLQAARPVAGGDASCPNCGEMWVRIVEREKNSAGEKAYELQLLDIAPSPASMGLMDDKHRWQKEFESLPDAQEVKH